MMAERRVRATIVRFGGRALRGGLMRPVARRFFACRAAVIFYHAVWPAGDERMRLFGGVERDRFAAELRRLRGVFHFVALRELLDASAGNGAVPSTGRPMLSVTFDDGFDLAAGGAADVLDELGVPATVFINTASVRYERLMWQHRFIAIRALRGDAEFVRRMAELQKRIGSEVPMRGVTDHITVTRSWPVDQKEELTDALWEACGMPPMERMLETLRPYFDWAGLRAWMRRGHDVGFHTRSHPFCSRLTEAQMRGELIEPVHEMQQELGLESRPPFAYPFGDRLGPGLERRLYETGVFGCLLGTAGFSPIGTPAEAMDRVEVEAGVDAEVFGRPILRAMRGRAG